MADENTGGAVTEVKVSDEGYIDGITVTLKDGTSKDYPLRPENYDDVEAARKAAEAASGLANTAAANADSATAAARGAAAQAKKTANDAAAAAERKTSAAITAAESATEAATSSASACDEAAGEARASKTACDEATKKAALLLPLGLFVDDDGDICQKEN